MTHGVMLGVMRLDGPELRGAGSRIKPGGPQRRKLMWKFHFPGWTPSECVRGAEGAGGGRHSKL